VIDRLSYDLRRAFPDMGGLSSRNLQYMRTFAGAWTEREIAQAPLAQLTWYHQSRSSISSAARPQALVRRTADRVRLVS
jgi:hypothetical protein